MSNKRILVPGGAGYIGAHTVAALVESGAQVVVVDDLETGFKQAVDPAAKFYQGDIRDKAFLDGVFEKEPIDAVIHFAAYSQVGESMENPLKYYDNNLNGTRVLLSSMIEHDVKKIVFSSTAATYGEPRNIPILESDPTEPTNAYGATKLAMEGMMRWCARAYGLKFVSLRYFNACGAHSRGHIGEAHNPESHLIPLILQVPNGQRPYISIFGDDYPTRDGTCVRDYIHVMDLAQGHVAALDKLKENCGLFICNLGTGKGYSVLDVLHAYEKACGHPLPYVMDPRRPGDVAACWADPSKARAELGWTAKYGMEEMCATSWRWQSENPDGYGKR